VHKVLCENTAQEIHGWKIPFSVPSPHPLQTIVKQYAGPIDESAMYTRHDPTSWKFASSSALTSILIRNTTPEKNRTKFTHHNFATVHVRHRVMRFSAKCSERNCLHDKCQFLNTAIKCSLLCSWQVNYLKTINSKIFKANS